MVVVPKPRTSHTPPSPNRYSAPPVSPNSPVTSSNDWGYNPTIKTQHSYLDAPRSSCDSTSTTVSQFLPKIHIRDCSIRDIEIISKQQREQGNTHPSEMSNSLVSKPGRQGHAAWYSATIEVSAPEKVNLDYRSLIGNHQHRNHMKSRWYTSPIATPPQAMCTSKQTTRRLHRLGDVKRSKARVPDSETVFSVFRFDVAQDCGKR